METTKEIQESTNQVEKSIVLLGNRTKRLLDVDHHMVQLDFIRLSLLILNSKQIKKEQFSVQFEGFKRIPLKYFSNIQMFNNKSLSDSIQDYESPQEAANYFKNEFILRQIILIPRTDPNQLQLVIQRATQELKTFIPEFEGDLVAEAQFLTDFFKQREYIPWDFRRDQLMLDRVATGETQIFKKIFTQDEQLYKGQHVKDEKSLERMFFIEMTLKFAFLSEKNPEVFLVPGPGSQEHPSCYFYEILLSERKTKSFKNVFRQKQYRIFVKNLHYFSTSRYFDEEVEPLARYVRRDPKHMNRSLKDTTGPQYAAMILKAARKHDLVLPRPAKNIPARLNPISENQAEDISSLPPRPHQQQKIQEQNIDPDAIEEQGRLLRIDEPEQMNMDQQINQPPPQTYYMAELYPGLYHLGAYLPSQYSMIDPRIGPNINPYPMPSMLPKIEPGFEPYIDLEINPYLHAGFYPPKYQHNLPRYQFLSENYEQQEVHREHGANMEDNPAHFERRAPTKEQDIQRGLVDVQSEGKPGKSKMTPEQIAQRRQRFRVQRLERQKLYKKAPAHKSIHEESREKSQGGSLSLEERRKLFWIQRQERRQQKERNILKSLEPKEKSNIQTRYQIRQRQQAQQEAERQALIPAKEQEPQSHMQKVKKIKKRARGHDRG